jgi:hypothetical protein
VFRSNGGTDTPNNLITQCKTCHDALHALPDAATQSLLLSKKAATNTAPATQVSTISAYLEKIYPEATFTFGYETKFNREQQQLPKTHFIDAMCIAHDSKTKLRLPSVVYKMVSISKGDYQQTECQPWKSPNKSCERKKLPRTKIYGLKRLDRVIYSHCEAFVKGRMSTGYGILQDIDGNKLDFGHIPKLCLMKRIGARKTCLISQKTIINTTSNTILYSSVNVVKTSSKVVSGKR